MSNDEDMLWLLVVLSEHWIETVIVLGIIGVIALCGAYA